MALSKKLTFWFEHFFPGLIASIERLNSGGDFRDGELKVRTSGENAIHGVSLGLVYVFADRHVIKITERLGLKPTLPAHRYLTQAVQLADWEAYHYALRYQNPQGESIFGLDFHELCDDSGKSRGLIHHVHFEVHTPHERHTSAQEFEPDPQNTDPRHFVVCIADYRRTKKFPFTRKKKT